MSAVSNDAVLWCLSRQFILHNSPFYVQKSGGVRFYPSLILNTPSD